MPRRARPTVVHPGALREVYVVRVEDITPGLRRVTLTGEQLGSFSPARGVVLPGLVSTGFDDDVRVILPYPGETEPVLPTFEDGRWHSPRGRRPLGRHYTVRRYDPLRHELDIDVVKHGVGVAATWAYRARPGDRVHLGGPSSSQGLPDGVDWLLVVGDDTAAPAIARLLEQLPAGASAQVFLEVASTEHRQPLRELPGVRVTWLTRGVGAGLVDAVRAIDWWDGDVFVWVAGEQSVVRELRRHVVEDRGVPRAYVDFTGYWRRTEAVVSSLDPAVPDLDQEHEPGEELHHRSEILPPLAVRTAVELGLGPLIWSGVGTLGALAGRTGTDPRALRKFLRYLEAIDLVESEDGSYRLTAAGEELTDPTTIQMLRPDGVMGQLEQGFFGLGESLRTGRASYESVTGRDYAALRSDRRFSTAYLDEAAADASFLAASLADATAVEALEHVAVLSDAAGAVAAALTERHPDLWVTIVAAPGQAAWLSEDLPRSLPVSQQADRVTVVDGLDGVGPVAATLLVDCLARQTDDEAVDLLVRAARGLRPGGVLLLLETALDEAEVDDHDAAADLLHLTVHGSGFRSDAEVDGLVAAAGLVLAAAEPAGWGDRLRTLRPASPRPTSAQAPPGPGSGGPALRR